MSKKERFDISDIENSENGLENMEGFNHIQENQVGFDGEKGFTDNIAIIQRISDKKYFKVEYSDYGRGEDSLQEEVAIEVVAKTKTVTYYE